MWVIGGCLGSRGVWSPVVRGLLEETVGSLFQASPSRDPQRMGTVHRGSPVSGRSLQANPV